MSIKKLNYSQESPTGYFYPQVFIDPHWFSQNYIADPPLVLPQIEYWLGMEDSCRYCIAQRWIQVDFLEEGANSRAKPELRARSTREMMAKPKPRAKLEKSGKGSGEGPRWRLPRKILKNETWNRAIWCIAQAKVKGHEQNTFISFEEHDSSFMQELTFITTSQRCNHARAITGIARVTLAQW